MPIMVELDSEPTESEIENAIKDLANDKAPGNDAIPQKKSNKGYQSYFPIYMNFFLSAGEMVKFCKTCVMPRLSYYSRIKVIAVNVTTIMEFPSQVLLAKCSHELFLPDYRYWQIIYIQNLSVALNQKIHC